MNETAVHYLIVLQQRTFYTEQDTKITVENIVTVEQCIFKSSQIRNRWKYGD